MHTMPDPTQSSETSREVMLDVRHLTTKFRVAGKWHAAVRDVSFALRRNETLALVGESGCGKSVTALSVLGLATRCCRSGIRSPKRCATIAT